MPSIKGFKLVNGQFDKKTAEALRGSLPFKEGKFEEVVEEVKEEKVAKAKRKK